MADEYSYSTSCEQQETEFEFSSRQYAYIPDQNSGNYPNSQITFDLASLSNSGKFVDWSQSLLTIPLVMNVATSAALTAAYAENVFGASLKNFPTLINSLSVEITNNQVVNLTQFSNLDINYKVLSSMSSEDAITLSSLGFAKDTAESISYNGAVNSAAGSGLGEINNVIKTTSFTPTAGFNAATFPQNAGRLARMMNTSFDPTTSASSLANCAATGKNYAVQTVNGVTYYIIATIPLRFLHDIFKKLPLSKGMYMRLIINTNCGCTVISTVGPTSGAQAAGSYLTSNTVSMNNVCPIMLSPITSAALAGNGLNLTGLANNGTITTTLNIAKYGAVTHPTMQQCRVYACLYEMAPLAEERYFSLVPTKKILYNDILTFQTLNVGAGAQVSQILSNGVSRMRYLLIYPFLSSVVNGSANITDVANGGVVLGTPMNSPFTSCPSTTCPQAAITNGNILLSGTNLYQSNINYNFEHFLQEVRPSNSINGGLSLGMSSGLLSQSDWENGYRIHYFDLSRKVSQASDDISRSLQVVFTNASKVSMDYYYVIGYQREVQISTSTGSLVI